MPYIGTSAAQVEAMIIRAANRVVVYLQLALQTISTIVGTIPGLPNINALNHMYR